MVYVRVGSVCIYCTAMSVNDGTCGVCEGESACHSCLCQRESTLELTLRLSLDSFFVVCVCVCVAGSDFKADLWLSLSLILSVWSHWSQRCVNGTE